MKGRPIRTSRPESASTAAAFCGVFGLADAGLPHLGDGGLYAFCREFNARFDHIASTRRPELRRFAAAERETRAKL